MITPESKALGEAILDAIQEAGMTRAAFARSADVTNDTLTRAVSGHGTTVATLQKFSTALGKGSVYSTLRQHFHACADYPDN
jgi:predicted transcriptional regulator